MDSPREGFLTVTEFCRDHRMSRAVFYELQQRGEGPDLARIGRRTYVSTEAASDWRRRVEAKTRQGAGRG